jgi:phage terminase large subunit-like protein
MKKKIKKQTQNRKQKINSLTTDRATIYAQKVTSGEIVAGPYVRGACQRHLNDLEKSKNDGYSYYFDEKCAAHAISFFEEILCLNGGDFEGKPFLLFSWEDFIVGSIFGWKRKEDHKRRFRVVYVETGKGSGKSPICAGVGLIGLCADNEQRAEIYAAATDKDQAAILFRDAIAFYDQSPELQKRLATAGGKGKEWMLSHHVSNSFFRIISSENDKSGMRPHMALNDEIHEHKDGTVIKMLRAGFKFRKQPLLFMITNSGHDKTSICWEYHDLGTKVACEQLQNDEFFSYICALDEKDLKDDKYLYDESSWIKANPSLDDGIPGYDYIRGLVKEAEGISSNISTVQRLNFCVWTEAENPWISSEIWNPLRDDKFNESLFAGRICTAGLDLSSVNDLSSLNFLFAPIESDPYCRLLSFFWVPKENLRRKVEKDHVPYDVWVKQGNLFTSDGPTISKTDIVKFLYQCSLKYTIQGVAYDRDRMSDFREFAAKAEIEIAVGSWDKEEREWKFDNQTGIKMMPFGQNAKSMSPAIEKFETLLLNKELRHGGNPAQTWCMANAVITFDDDKNRKISKRKSVGRVDGAVTAVMAAGIYEKKDIVKSVYDGLTKGQMIARMTGK